MTTARNKRLKRLMKEIFRPDVPDSDPAGSENVYLTWDAFVHFEQTGNAWAAREVRRLLERGGQPGYGMDPMEFWILAEEHEESDSPDIEES